MSIVTKAIQHTIAADDQEVTITVAGGDAQQLVSLQLDTPAGYFEGTEISQSIGLGSALKGQVSSLTGTVTDSNKLSDFGSLSILLTNGALTESARGEFSDGDVSINFRVSIKHV